MLPVALSALLALGLSVPPVDAYAPVQITAASRLPQVSGPYNLSDTITPMVTQDFYSSIVSACDQSYVKELCSSKLDEAEAAIRLLFETIDRDQFRIYKGLFAKTNESAELSNEFARLEKELLLLNSTIFGKNQSGVLQPGILRDLLTISDGVRQLQVISTGQKKAITAAQRQQKLALKTYASVVKTSSKEIASQLGVLMERLVKSRTAVQSGYFRSMWNAASESLADINTQADEFMRESQDKLYSLANKYNEWMELTENEITAIKSRAQAVSFAIQDLMKSRIPTVKDQWRREHLAQAQAVQNQAESELEQSLANLQNKIKDHFNVIANFVADKIDMNQKDFAFNLDTFKDNLENRLSGLAQKILPDTDEYGKKVGDGTLIDTTEKDTRDALNDRIRTIAERLKAFIVPLLKDVQGKLGQSQNLASQVTDLQSLLTNDTLSVITTARGDVSALAGKVLKSSGEVKASFDKSLPQISSSMDFRITDKVMTAKSKLESIFGSIQGNANNVVSDQYVQGATATDAANASETAAQLSAARQQLAADSASAQLQTGVGVVAASLSDTTATADEINRNNQNRVYEASRQASVAQQSMLENAHSQLLAQSGVAQSAINSVQSSFHQSQLAGQDLTASLEQDGLYLDQQVRYNTAQSGQVVAGASDLLHGAEQGGAVIMDEMSSFESTAQSSVNSFISRVSGYQSQLVQDGRVAVAGASNSAGNQAASVLNNLGVVLGGTTAASRPFFVPPSKSSAAVAHDQMSLSQDVSSGSASINNQAAAVRNVISSRANQAMLQSVSSIKSTSTDSQEALADLINYNADLIDDKRRLVISTGGSAVNASLEAAKYLNEAATNYANVSQTFLSDVESLASQGSLNQTKVLAQLNETLTDISAIYERFRSKLNTTVANNTARLPLSTAAGAAAVVAAVHAKLSSARAAILAATNGTIDTNALLNNAKSLNEYIDILRTNFQKQRASYNAYAQQTAIRRIAALTGINESVLAQKIDTLKSLTVSDGDEAASASRTTTMLQSLQQTVEMTKNQGDVTKVTSLLNSIGSGVNSFTNSLRQQMDGSNAGLAQRANAATAGAGKTLGSLAYSAATSAGSLGDNLLNAMKTVQQSALAGNITAFSGQKDFFAIAGMLKNLSQSSQQKIVQLISNLQSGNITMSGAIEAAQAMQRADLTSLYDVLMSLSPYVANHESIVNKFLSNLNKSSNTISATVARAMSDHEALQGDIITDVASNQRLLSLLNQNLSVTLNATEAQSIDKVHTLEDLLNDVIYSGTRDGFSEADSSQYEGTGGWISMLLPSSPSNSSTTSSSSLSQIRLHRQRENDENPGIPGRVVNLKETILQGQISLGQQKTHFMTEVDKDMQAGNNILKQIIDTVKFAVRLV